MEKGGYRICDLTMLLLARDDRYRRGYFRNAVKRSKELIEEAKLKGFIEEVYGLRLPEETVEEIRSKIKEDLKNYENNYDKWREYVLERLRPGPRGWGHFPVYRGFSAPSSRSFAELSGRKPKPQNLKQKSSKT